MTEARSQLDLRLNEGIAVAVQSYQENLLHLVRQLPETAKDGRRYRREHLRPQKLEDFLRGKWCELAM